MNEEEKQAIEYIKNCLDNEYNFKNATRQKDKDAYNVILSLINKQQKEIEELKEVDFTTSYMQGFYDGKNKMKDKIKEKIKEIETLSMLDFVEKEKFDFKYSLDGIYCMQKGVVFILKELLGE